MAVYGHPGLRIQRQETPATAAETPKPAEPTAVSLAIDQIAQAGGPVPNA